MRSNAARLEVLGERVEDVIARVEVARRERLAHAPAGLMPGTSAVAVPIMSAGGEALGAITVTAMAERLGVERFEVVVERMRQAAGGIAGRYERVFDRG
ncbi:hypothetical protein D3C85_892680 [compost metagenome]